MSSSPDASGPQTVIAIYRVKAAEERPFRELLRRHHPALVGLATSDPPRIYRGEEAGGAPLWFEIFEWANAEAPGRAHDSPEVMAIWGPMGDLVEERDGRPKFEFPHVAPVAL